MSERWDVIVIGAGLGGMLTAAILARSGRGVLVLEREAAVGGRLRSYDVDGFVIDAGTYLWPNLHLDTALAAAGVTEFRSSPIPPTQVMRVYVQGDGGRRLPFPWPGRAESSGLLDTATTALCTDSATFGALSRLWEELAALPDSTVESLMHTPVAEGLAQFTSDPRVAEAFRRNVMLFGAYAPDQASMGECIGLRRRRRDAGRPKPECPGANRIGGVRALPLAIRAVLEAQGVDLRLNHTVDRIVIESGRVTGIFAHGREPFEKRFEAPIVIANLPIWTLFELIGSDHFPPDFVESARRFAVVGGTVCAAFAFDGLPRLRQTGEIDTFPGWTRLLIGEDRSFGGGMVWTTLHSPRNAPPGKHILQAMRLSPHTDIADARRVQIIHNAFRTLLDEIYTDVEEKLIWNRSWTTRDGSEYMTCAARRPSVQVPGLGGLYVVGETTDVPAVQMDAAALSALRCAELVQSSGK